MDGTLISIGAYCALCHGKRTGRLPWLCIPGFVGEPMLSLKLLDKIIPALLANCLINNFSIMYKYKQDLAMAYFPDCSKATASKLLAREIHGNKPLMTELQSAGYTRTRKLLSPRQLKILFSYLGEP